MRKRVVLPAPSGPMKPKSSPCPTATEISFSAVVSPKRFQALHPHDGCRCGHRPSPAGASSTSTGIPILSRPSGLATRIFTA
jgi:hypothetical protein